MKRKLSLLLVLVLAFSAILNVCVSAASYPSLSSSAYCEFTAAKQINVWKDSVFSKRGTSSPAETYSAYISKNDICYIYKITSKYAQVNYPTPSGRRTGYIRTSDLLGGNISPSTPFTASSKVTTLKYKNGVSTGYYEKNDTVYKLSGTNYNVIYTAKSGKRAYKLAYANSNSSSSSNTSSNSNQSTKSNGSASTVSTANNSSGYSKYTGIDYTKILAKANITSTEYNNRIKLLNKAQKMVTVIWTAPKTFHTWKSQAGVYNSNRSLLYSGNPSTYTQFVKGCKYTGVPYAANSNYNQLDDTGWLSLIKQSSPKLEGTVTYKNTQKNTTFQGIDCAGFVYRSYLAMGNYKCSYLQTSKLLTSSYWTKISASSALPGDILLKSGHVMIYVGKTSSGKIAVMESTAEASGCRYDERSSVSGYSYYRYKNIAK